MLPLILQPPLRALRHACRQIFTTAAAPSPAVRGPRAFGRGLPGDNSAAPRQMPVKCLRGRDMPACPSPNSVFSARRTSVLCSALRPDSAASRIC